MSDQTRSIQEVSYDALDLLLLNNNRFRKVAYRLAFVVAIQSVCIIAIAVNNLSACK